MSRVASLGLLLTGLVTSCQHSPPSETESRFLPSREEGAGLRAGPFRAGPFRTGRPAAGGLDPAALGRLSHQVERWTEEGQLMGAELLVIEDRTIVLHEAHGRSDREEGRPLERGSIQRIRSMAKPFVGTAALLLVSEGRLSLDDRVAKYLPAFEQDAAAKITVGQLMTHTSGLQGFGRLFQALRERDGRSPELGSLEEVARAAGNVGPTGIPGRYFYSDAGSATLAAVVARVAGMPVEDFLQQRILDPLGLVDTHTAYRRDVPWRDRLASTYEWNDETQQFERYWHPGLQQEARFFRGAGGMYSTALDQARFAQAWLEWSASGGLLPRELAREALQPHADRAATEGYGYHWTVSKELSDGLPLVFGHGGSDGTRLWAFPEQRVLVVYMSQSRGHSMRGEFATLLADEFPWARVLVAEEQRRAEVQSAVDGFLADLADLDLEGLSRRFAPDASVFFPLAGETERADGWSEIGRVFRRVFDARRAEGDGPPYMDIEPRSTRIQLAGATAVVTFHLGSANRRTLVLEERDGAWLVAHLHGSRATE